MSQLYIFSFHVTNSDGERLTRCMTATKAEFNRSLKEYTKEQQEEIIKNRRFEALCLKRH